MISQKIKDLTNTTNEYQREMIENTYKELEKDKTNRIEQLQKLLEQQKHRNRPKSNKKTRFRYQQMRLYPKTCITGYRKKQITKPRRCWRTMCRGSTPEQARTGRPFIFYSMASQKSNFRRHLL